MLCLPYGIYFDFIVYAPKKEEFLNLRSSRDVLFMYALERALRSLRLLIDLAIKNYYCFLLSLFQ